MSLFDTTYEMPFETEESYNLKLETGKIILHTEPDIIEEQEIAERLFVQGYLNQFEEK